MLRDRYENDKFFIGIQELTSKMDPQLARIDELLEDDKLYQIVRGDLEKRYRLTAVMGRPSTPVEVILRMLAVKHLYNLSYEKTERHVRDSLVLRRFCRVYLEEVPEHSTLNKWALTIQPETMQAVNERIVALATELRVTKGRKLRTDGTVVETNIHHPTDNSLLADSVRVISRTLKRAKKLLAATGELSKEVFRNRTRSARRAARQIANAAKRGGEATKKTYRRLVHITRASIRQAQAVLEILKAEPSMQADRLENTLETFIPRALQVIDQAVRRVFDGEKVPASDKILSIFEAHTNIIKTGKTNRDTDFGHKVWLSEIDGGIISRYEVLDGNPPDQNQWKDTLDHHIHQFNKPPVMATADRGVFSPENEQYAVGLNVKHVVLPACGAVAFQRKHHEQQSWFRRGRRWHAGVEGRISVAKRKHGLARCFDKGQDGFRRYVGWGILANNLTMIGRALA